MVTGEDVKRLFLAKERRQLAEMATEDWSAVGVSTQMFPPPFRLLGCSCRRDRLSFRV